MGEFSLASLPPRSVARSVGLPTASSPLVGEKFAHLLASEQYSYASTAIKCCLKEARERTTNLPSCLAGAGQRFDRDF